MSLKYSRQRETIKEFLISRKDHPTADTIYMNVRKSYPNISLGTVYRNLTLLAEIGEISRIRIGDCVDHFDGDTKPHYHFICNHCGSILDFETNPMAHWEETALGDFDGQIEGHVTYFYGVCGNCLKEIIR